METTIQGLGFRGPLKKPGVFFSILNVTAVFMVTEVTGC